MPHYVQTGFARRFLFTCICFSFIKLAQAQLLQYSRIDTVYLSEDWDSCSIDNATYYKIMFYENGPEGKGSAKYYYLNHILRDVYQYSNMKEHILDGEYKSYYPDGKLKESINYFNDSYHGSLRTYFPSGQLKRDDLFQNDSLITGRCYSIKGKDTAYYPYYVQAEFKGGDDKMLRYLNKKIKYPKSAVDKKINGRVEVKFKVGKDGKLYDVRIHKSLHPLFDEEALRVIKGMPRWKPGIIDGEPVDTIFLIPIDFIGVE